METGEETKVLRKKEAKKKLRRRESAGLLNIQLLVVRLLLHHRHFWSVRKESSTMRKCNLHIP